LRAFAVVVGGPPAAALPRALAGAARAAEAAADTDVAAVYRQRLARDAPGWVEGAPRACEP